MVMSLLRVEEQGLCKHPGMKNRRALPTATIVRHDIDIIRPGLDGHACGLEIVTLIAPWQEHLTDRYAVVIEHQYPPLAAHRHIDIPVTVYARGVWSRACEVVRNRRPDGRNLRRRFKIGAKQTVAAKLGCP